MTAYTSGVYDLFHIGHVNLFKRIKQQCSKLIVGVHNDEDVMSYKNKPIINYYDRLEIVKSCRYVDEIYENAELITTDNVLIKVKANFVFAGNENIEHLKKFYQVSSGKLILLDRTENISTSKIKNILAL